MRNIVSQPVTYLERFICFFRLTAEAADKRSAARANSVEERHRNTWCFPWSRVREASILKADREVPQYG